MKDCDLEEREKEKNIWDKSGQLTWEESWLIKEGLKYWVKINLLSENVVYCLSFPHYNSWDRKSKKNCRVRLLEKEWIWKCILVMKLGSESLNHGGK